MKIKDLSDNGLLTYYACVSCIVVLPIYIHWLPPFMVLWVLLWFFQNRNDFNKISVSGNTRAVLFLLFLGLFVWQTGELLLANSLNAGFERIFKRLSFLLFPLVLFYPGIKIERSIDLILRIFALSVFVYLLYCFGNAFHSSLVYKDGKWIFNAYHELYTYESFFMGARLSAIVHPTYLSMYVLLSALISLDSLFEKSMVGPKRYLWIVSSFVFAIVIYLLSSRAGVIAAFIVLPLFCVIKFYGKMSKAIIIVVLVVAALGSVVMLKTNERLKYSLEELSSSGINGTFAKDTRYLIWKSAWGVIRSNLVLGVGTGNASEELKKEFKNRGYTEGYYDDLNAHNQFIEILLENGIIGLILFLSILGYLVYLAISDHNLMLGLFIIIIVVFFMFESVLNRLAGITFFPFFSFLLVHYKTQKDY
jgi:O-antigen ligase